MRWFCKCVWKLEGRLVQLDEIICMLDQSVLTRREQTVATGRWKPEHGLSVWSAGWQDGHMLSACLLPACLPAACPPHGYFINIIMSWILKDFSQQENRGLLCHDLAIYPLWQCHYVPPPHSLLWRELIENGSCSLELLRIMSGPL